ncbi:MAG: methyltransferase domain-containing protein [Pseudohongiella sp.]|uniref:putative RNA methyltransferase n=1 Tax=Pseudohongiella sp. TaxID=1979412 RepID=UPI0034A04F6A
MQKNNPTVPFSGLACPLDGAALTARDGSWRCEHGHSFDVARQGYVNLLPVQKKRSRDPGDSKDMVAARQRFLAAGHYAPVAAAINKALLADLATDKMAGFLDAGCGEGYYLRQLAVAAQRPDRLALMGLDISKWAVQSAAKQDHHVCWAVGSNANLPVLSGSLDRVLCMFGFPVYSEFARVLRDGGLVVQLDPGSEHLRELREIIYPSLRPARENKSDPPAGFERVATESIRYVCDIRNAGLVQDLLTMTPHLYRANAEGRARAAALTSLSVTIDVGLVTLRKTTQTETEP